MSGSIRACRSRSSRRALPAGPEEDTRVSGVVQTSVGGRVRGARAVVRNTGISALSGAGGRFTIRGVPPGRHRLIIEGSAANDLARGLFHAGLERAPGVLSGVDNQLDQVAVIPQCGTVTLRP